ncbi:hypothetical protein CcaverHIS002_0212330 [Cutaneotrichosporon cavernicola]|uniref:Glutamate-rich WD repeat-containing protein 1 n=1 Tax=Cutaneotrichosporon cavernicola TaxID=279322 RepID=A0AA48L0G7_9TREE|nr:uncharacterized protein CcaverHIS019_0212330 [Cutaneotrichosporon cavernicola]BEI82073.1 hypothetical protein CcaverHIS002_0212330 [Cutaneotrichosporon cavernicola]BEI89871.1 hypothetical protein CcaverHIS019_0212330 [Cutaneotrichosporon cavernicola]BEI97641.1 hypothetical protein CcaverHIS631_0212300 [Cutaneotrichosporon cavernicola]BEJ05419.1 hypothetical protein CcaverHIS641_0212360 [Cutaneotrichosporon cavernicola]
MSSKKRSAEEENTPSKAVDMGQDTARAVAGAEEMGEFEDRWEDEIEAEVVDGDAMEEEGDEFTHAPEDEDAPEPKKQTYLPGVAMGPNEQLVADNSVYPCLHALSYAWPCLSFDILKDDLGVDRTGFPQTAWLVAGTQAGDIPGQGRAKDEVVVMRLSGLSRTQHDDDSDGEADDDEVDEDAKLDFLTLPHVGAVNRIRAAPATPGNLPNPYHVASFSETGKVHIWDVKPLIDTLSGGGKPRQKTPVHTITAHGRAEGYAVEWGRSGLLTGDIDSKIYLTTTTPTGFSTSQAYTSHTSSVEDLQWSPAEPTVFASASADRTVRVWDVRTKSRKCAVSVRAHDDDVNVISWNRNVDYLLVSGGDEGAVKVWDLRMFKSKPKPVAHFTWHTAPITSVEWHPSDPSVFAASGADDQVTLWDLSVEGDDEQAGDAPVGPDGRVLDVPPQLLFVHQGQKDVKELHWHPQVPGMVVTTAADGFNVFKTISV